MTSQKNQLSATDMSLPARRKFNTICRSTAVLSGFPAPSHFFMKERMVALEGGYGAGERNEMTPDWESWMRFEPKLLVARPMV